MPAATYDFASARALLSRTPPLLDAWLRDLPDVWLRCAEGERTWNAIDILGHLIEGERSDWLFRTRWILERGEGEPFPPFDRFAQDARPPRKIGELLDEFAASRRQSLAELESLGLTVADLERRGVHPEFGPVTLGQHLSTWVAHDLTHVTQIARVMAKRYAAAVGPWRDYLRILQ
ncbi:MAG: DinB family protein [Planctomycetes bacterium]|nr:DinB family protein [Planctomycetota bacterium]